MIEWLSGIPVVGRWFAEAENADWQERLEEGEAMLDGQLSEGSAVSAAVQTGEGGDVSRLVARQKAENLKDLKLSTVKIENTRKKHTAVAGYFGGGTQKP